MNKKLFSAAMAFAIVVVSLVAKGYFPQIGIVAQGQVGTSVGGVLSKDTTWTAANSPYIINSTVQIPANVTLTIAPGVTVISNVSESSSFANRRGNMFLIRGWISAIGTADKKIIFDGRGYSNFFNAYYSDASAFVGLDHCVIRDGASLWWGGHGYFQLTNSELSNLSYYSLISYPANAITIAYNTFTNSAGFSIGQSSPGYVYIEFNTFSGKNPSLSYTDALIQNWACYGSLKTTVLYNSFVNMSGIILKLPPGSASAAMEAAQNYWGTTDTTIINSMIYDKNDDITCAGFIDYLPILLVPHPDTPVVPEFPSVLLMMLLFVPLLAGTLFIGKKVSKVL
jgi:hypothetical protein